MDFLIIILIAIGLTFILQQLITSRANTHSLKAQINSLEKENAELLKENIILEKQVSEKTHKDDILLEYPFDKTLGIRKHKTTGVAFCNNCMVEKGLKSQLKIEPDGWFCSICSNFIKKPNSNSAPSEKENRKWDLGF